MVKSEKTPRTENTQKRATASPRATGRKRSSAAGAVTSAIDEQPKGGVPKANAGWVPPAEEVALRAYELYLERGRVHGHDLEDWTEAERQVRARYGR